MDTHKPQELWTRRLFLKSSLVGLALLGSRLAFPDLASAASLPDGRLHLYNANTDERLTVRYRNRSGRYDPSALKDINFLFRCHNTNQVCQMDVQLLENLNRIVKLVGQGQEVKIYSGYRSPSYNDLLVRLGRGAAPNSLHTTGQAVDFSIPGVKLSKIWRTAMKLQAGGVGNYRRRGFIHIDTGPFRYW
ncbi:MAG: YcbK family protein [Nitrospirales bacterium]